MKAQNVIEIHAVDGRRPRRDKKVRIATTAVS